ncbi:MAG: HEAT repeat domain-containing protein [Deltaproteobacteria bacterium]
MVSPHPLVQHVHRSLLASGWEVVLLLGMLAAAAVLVILLFVLNYIHRRQADRAVRLEGKVVDLLALWAVRHASPAELAWLARLGEADRCALFHHCLGALPRLSDAARARVRTVLRESGLLDREVAALRHRDWARRADACRILGGIGHAAAVPALIERLGDPDETVRQQAIAALGDLGAVQGLGPIVEALDASNGWGSLLAIMAVSRMGPRSVPAIGALLAASTSPARTKALLQITGQLGMAADPALIRSLAGHGDAEVRIEAVRTLGSIAPEPESVDVCLAALDDPAWPTRALAARSLGSLGDTRAIPRLERAMGDPAYWVRHRAGEALARLSDAGRAALEHALGNANPFVRDMATQELFMSAPPAEAAP